MKNRRLGRTDLDVSVICLGTMTWGEQNSEADAHAQLDLALDRGVNFVDAAEVYPIPPRAETYGRTEECIGTWFQARRNRHKVILATKVAGANNAATYVRGGPRLDREQITAALEGSLKRLRTDYVDLYQTHTPDRPGNYFSRPGYVPPPGGDGAPLAETLGVLADLQKAGKIRHIGVSNETPWGLMRHVALAETAGAPRVAAIQNVYSLLNRGFETGLAEIATREECGLLAYSPLAMGVLSGKYLGGRKPEGARLTLFTRFVRYATPRGEQAVAAYVELARRHGLDPAQMALAYVLARPFVSAAIIGATTLAQLERNIASVEVGLSPAVLEGIEAIHAANPNPCP